jgi:uncharacterized protein YoaH (UPF0181 family)
MSHLASAVPRQDIVQLLALLLSAGAAAGEGIALVMSQVRMRDRLSRRLPDAVPAFLLSNPPN